MLDKNYGIFKVDAYPDADFSVIYRHKNPNDPACANSCTGFIITISGCPVLWVSALQTKTALSTMESETISLARSCLDMFPIINITKFLGKSVGLAVGVPSMKLSVCEDNDGALILARTLPPK